MREVSSLGNSGGDWPPERVIRVSHPDGTPAVGAEVRVAPVVGSDEPAAHRTTNAAGRARVRMANPRYVVTTWKDTEAAIAPFARSGPTDVTLEPARPVHGRVVTTDDAPVSGARCVLRWQWPGHFLRGPDAGFSASTSSDGAFVFPAVPATILTARAALRTTAAGFVRALTMLDATGNAARPIEISLEPGRSVNARCVDEDGRPVRGVSVSAGWAGRTPSGADGRFVLEGLCLSGASIQIDADHYEPISTSVEDGSSDLALGDLVLKRGLVLRGVVVGSDGRPAREAEVLVEPMDDGGWYRSCETEDDGRFVIDGLPDVPLVLEIEGARRRDRGRVLCIPDVRPGGPELQLAFAPGLHVQFWFLKASDRSPVGTRRSVIHVRGPGESDAESCRYEHSTDGDVRTLVLRIETPGVYSARVSIPGYETVELEGVEVCADRDTPVDVLLVESSSDRA